MRFGLLGTGHWAREVHGTALAAHPEVELAGVWGRNQERSSSLASIFRVPAYSEIDALLAAVDAVAIALPPDVQGELALRAAKAGCHLLLDKPVSLSVAAADAIVTEVRARDLASVVFFTNRFQPATVAALDEATRTGGWLGGRSTYFGSIYEPGSPYAESVWRQEHGGLWDIGPHALSLLAPVLGPVVTVTAAHGPRQTAFVTLWHDGGAVSTMELTLDCALAASRAETVLHGESGWMTLPGFDGDAVASFGRAISTLIDSKGAHALDVQFGRDVVAVLAAAQESANTGSIVRLPTKDGGIAAG